MIKHFFIITSRYDESLIIFEKTLDLLQKNISTFQFRFYFNDFFSRNKKYLENTVNIIFFILNYSEKLLSMSCILKTMSFIYEMKEKYSKSLECLRLSM